MNKFTEMQSASSRRIPVAPRLNKREFYPRSENSEIVNYIYNSWNEVNRVYKNKSTFVNGPNVVYYQPESLEGSNKLSNFVKFDLEAYWGKKAFQNCQDSNRSP